MTDSIHQRRVVESLATAADFAPDAPPSEVRQAQVHPSESPATESPNPPSRTRKRTEYTASEWAMSPHFLAYVQKHEPFKSMSAEEQNAWRDKFVAAQPADEVLNRWGKRFSQFCGVS
jgi:hypothetical protein